MSIEQDILALEDKRCVTTPRSSPAAPRSRST